MSKPVTGVAILMLIEEGKVRLADPVSKFIPEFKGLQVSADAVATAPAKREITVADLLTHTSGLVSGPANAEIAKTLPGMALLTDTTRPQESLERYLPRIAVVSAVLPARRALLVQPACRLRRRSGASSRWHPVRRSIAF